MSFEDKELWLFTPSDGGCDTCQAMAGVYSYAVAEPHPNGNCAIESGQAKVELVRTREELSDQYELLEEVTWVPKGGQSVVTKEWSTGTETTVSGGVSAEGGGFGISGGVSGSESATAGGSEQVTFPYDNDLGGESQMVVATYQVSIYQTIETYRAHWSEGMGMDFEFDVIAGTRQERSFTGYRTEAF